MNKLRVSITILSVLILCLMLPVSALAAQFSVSANPTSLPSEGGTVALSVTINNTGSAEMKNIVITSGTNRLFSASDGETIAAGASKTFKQDITVPASMVGHPIELIATWTEDGDPKSESFSVTVMNNGNSGNTPVLNNLNAKRKVSTKQASQGEVITLTYTLTNNGETAIKEVSVTDTEIAGKDPIQKHITVEPGVPYEITYEYTMGRATVTSSPVITYKQADGTVYTINVEPVTLGMVKSRVNVKVEAGTPQESGQTFKLTLTNDGNQKISKLKITDEQGNSVNSDAISLAIGESITLNYTVPTDTERNLVFYLKGVDGTDTEYSDHTETFTVKKYISPSLIGIDFKVEVVSHLDKSGSITLNFIVDNHGSLTMQNLKLSEEEYGSLYMLDTVEQGSKTITQPMSIGSPRDLNFTLSLEDPSGSEYVYSAAIKADYIEVDTTGTDSEPSESQDVVADVGSDISNAMKTALIVIIVLTVIACIALIFISALEKEERKRIAKRRAQRERALRAQLEANGIGNISNPAPRMISGGNHIGDSDETRTNRSRNHGSEQTSHNGRNPSSRNNNGNTRL